MPEFVSAMDTPPVAKQIVDESMTGIALRKLGLGNRDYLSPLTRGDGRR